MLRNCSGPSSEAHTPAWRAPAFGGTPSELADGPLRAWRAFAGRVAPPRARRRLRGHSRRVCGHGKAPAGAGAFGSAFEVLQDVCQVCGVVAAELFEEVDFDVHWGFLSLFPLCCTSILSTSTPPCQVPAVCPSPHFQPSYGTVGYGTVRQRGPHFSYRHVTYLSGTYADETVTYRRVTLPTGKLRLRTRKLRPSKLPRGNIRYRNITQT